MPIFGDFETFGEPIATAEDRDHVATVWRACKSGATGDPQYALKCYAPLRRKSKPDQPEDALDKDPAHEFLEGIKQLKKAHTEGGHGLVPIHDFGFADEGAWYVTDFYPRKELKAWIARRGGVDGAALRQVVQSVVTGCLALKRSRGFSHGNLKPANVFLAGKPRPLRRTPLLLADAYPAAPLQLARLAGEGRTVDEPLPQKIEKQDLRALGELLLQLVEGRLVSSAYDYNYPVASSPAWEHLGRDGERWRELCNRLLAPQLSLDKLNLESLAKEFRSRTKLRLILESLAKEVRSRTKLPLILAVGGTIVAVAVVAVYLASKPATQTVVTTPAIAPQGGDYRDTVEVKLTCETVGATIHYTLDGTDPTANSMRYNQAFVLTNTATVKARAVASGQKDSPVASARFAVTATPVVATPAVAQPTIAPDGGSHKDSVQVTLTCTTPGAAIYYTVDGSEPTASSSPYSGPFKLTETKTVKVRAVAIGQKDSPVASATFTVTATPVVAQPTITPAGGSHKDSVQVTLTCTTLGAAIYYTLDGTDPTASSMRYNQAFVLTNTATVKVRAVASGQKDSPIASARFAVTATRLVAAPVVAQPTMTPTGGSHQDSVSVALATATPEATIYYTLDGSVPTASSTRYNRTFTLTNTTTVRARAVASGQKDSPVASATITVTATPVVAQPTITPDGGSHKDSVQVMLTCTTPGAAIYYTVDGRDPTASSSRYVGPFKVTETKTVKVRAVASGQKDSPVASATFTVVATPLVASLLPNVAVEAGKTTSIPLSGSGPPGVELVYKVVSEPKQGQLGPLNGASLDYAAFKTASGQDSFTFTVSDGVNYSAEAKVSITINNPLKLKIDAARVAFEARRFSDADQRTKEALGLDPDNEDAKKLQGQITGELTKESVRNTCDRNFQNMLVWFGVLRFNDPRITDPEARKERSRDTRMKKETLEYYGNEAGKLEKLYKETGLLGEDERGVLMEKLKYAIKNHD